MKKLSYKEEFELNHGAAAYAKKLVQNAAWRKANPKIMGRYAEERSKRNTGKNQRVLLISDVHIGASTVDVDWLKEFAKKHWRGYPIILLGDLCDLGIEKGYQFDQKYGPQKQLDLAAEIFKPLNVVAYCEGNHCDRIWNKVGLLPYKTMFGLEASHSFELNGREISFYHGRSAAENMMLEHQKFVKWCNSDIIALGHSHDLARITFLRGKKIQHLIRTGSFLGRPRYVEGAGYAPKIRGYVAYDTEANFVHLYGLTEEDELFEM